MENWLRLILTTFGKGYSMTYTNPAKKSAENENILQLICSLKMQCYSAYFSAFFSAGSNYQLSDVPNLQDLIFEIILTANYITK